MKKKFAKQLLSGLLAAVLLVCMLPMTAFAQKTQVTISNWNSKDNSTLASDDPIWEVAGSPEIILGEPSLISPKQTTYKDAESGKSYELAKIQYLYFVGSDYTVESIEENLENCMVTFPENASNINIIYGWDITESSNPEDPEDPIYNHIKTLNRTVKQHGWALNPTKNEEDIDTYAVYTEKNIYLNYDATMDMEELGSVAFGQASWDILNMHSEEIYDETTVNLHFQFAPNVIERVCYLIAHHHTYDKIDGKDYQILVEADFLVNLYEDNLPEKAVRTAFDTRLPSPSPGLFPDNAQEA